MEASRGISSVYLEACPDLICGAPIDKIPAVRAWLTEALLGKRNAPLTT